MKKQILLVVGLLFSIVMQSSAFKIIISGGGRNHKFDYTYLDNEKCICRGSGFVNCGVTLNSVVQEKVIPGDKLVETVLQMLDEGKTKGEFTFEGILPVSFETDKEGVTTITTEEDYVTIEK